MDFEDEEDFVNYTNKYSIFSSTELRKWFKYKNNFTIALLVQGAL